MNRRQFVVQGLAAAGVAGGAAAAGGRRERRLLYVACPGIRNYLEFGGQGILVFDIEDGHRFVRRIPTFPVQEGVPAENVKGICAHAGTARLYVSTIRRVLALDLLTDRPVWTRAYEGGCDRMALSPDGRTMYLPSLEGPHWNVVDALTGDLTARVVTNSGAHNTVYGANGREVYLAGLKSPYLYVADTARHAVDRRVGPFSHSIRPFTVNASQTLCFVNVNELLGFEVGDLRANTMRHRVEVQGFSRGMVKRHGCPSHGVGLTPDESEIWVVDASNQRVHFFDAAAMPPKQMGSLALREQPGWVTFSIDGRYGYPSTGEVIDPRRKKIIAALADEEGRQVHSEKLLEIVFRDGRPHRAGDQFGIGRRAQ